MNIHDNTNWIRSLSEKEILERKFSEGRMLFTNSHIPLIAELKEKILATYKVKAKFNYLGYNGEKLMCNGQILCYAKSKFDEVVQIGKNVTVIESNISPQGSNKYPRVAAGTSNYAILEFISFGLPYVDPVNGWDIEIISIEPI